MAGFDEEGLGELSLGDLETFSGAGEGPGGSANGSGGEILADGTRGNGAWGQLHTEILEAWLIDEDVWGGEAMAALAKRLRCDLDEFDAAMRMVSEETLAVKRAERLLEAERIRNKDISWDRLEDAVLQKLDSHVRTARNLKVGELLAIAQTANRATRRSNPGGPNVTGNTIINMNSGGAADAQVKLPGPGQLGTMTLTLSPKTVGQLSRGITIDADVEKFSESVQMLGGDDVPILGKMADEV